MFDCFKNQKRELIADDEKPKVKVGLIVGHTKIASGARLAGTNLSEYQYNDSVAKLCVAEAKNYHLEASVYYRDLQGISGAYKQAIREDCDIIIELHFNAFNGKVTGTETLCTMERHDIELAGYVQEAVCHAFERGGMSRGVKPITRSTRGARNVYSAPGVANCLVEPFFGDHLGESKFAQDNRLRYAKSLMLGCMNFAKARGVL